MRLVGSVEMAHIEVKLYISGPCGRDYFRLVHILEVTVLIGGSLADDTLL